MSNKNIMELQSFLTFRYVDDIIKTKGLKGKEDIREAILIKMLAEGEEYSMASILKLHRHDKDKEIELELNYLKSLTIKQRFQMMIKKTKEIRKLLKRHGYRKTPQIIKRT